MEQNFVKLGDFHQSKGNLARAYAYYKKAYELNPDYKEAEDRYIHMRLVLMGRADKQLKDDLAAKNLMLKASGRVYEPKTTEDETIPETQIEKFKNETGLVLASKDGMPTVELVVAKSAADKAGIKTNDIIFTVWGKLTGYLELNTILDMIMESPSHEIMLDIKRKINMPLKKTNGTGFDSLGLGLDIKEGGLTATAIEKDSIAAKSGLAEGDTITAINGDTTRYASLKDAIQLFNESKASDIELDIIRRVMLWRKDI
jgi:C-terminal processing protease CtpA/Prc